MVVSKIFQILLVAQFLGINFLNSNSAIQKPSVQPTTIGSQVDDFNGDTLDSKWQWIREPLDPKRWNLSGGYLQIVTQQKDIFETNNTAPLMLQAAPAGDFAVETKITFSPSANHQQGGLILYDDHGYTSGVIHPGDDNYVRLTYGYFTKKAFQLGIEKEGVYHSFQVPAPLGDTFYLQIRKIGPNIAGYYSVDSINWTLVGFSTELNLTPTRIGLTAFGSMSAQEIPASFDYFAINSIFTFSQWYRSSVWTGDAAGEQDGSGHYWYEPGFDDKSWTAFNLPDQGISTQVPNDRYYRSHFTWDGISTISLNVFSDDGLRVFINGNYWDLWGNGWRQEGCINNPLYQCGQFTPVPVQQIPNEFLRIGDNIIAVDLWDNGGKYYMDLIPIDINLTKPLFLPMIKR